MNIDPEHSESMRSSLIGIQRMTAPRAFYSSRHNKMAMAHGNISLMFALVRTAVSFLPMAAIAAVSAFCYGFPLSAQAFDATSTNAQSQPLSAVPASVAQSNATVRPPLAATPGATRAPTEATNIANSGPTNSMDALDDRHKLTIGDRLSFRIVEDEDDPKEITVTVSGDVEVPYIGRFPVVGETCKEIAWKMKAELERKYYYHATVILAVNEWARSQGKIYIDGPVHMPGAQEIPSDEVLTLSKAIMRAGGFGDYADRHKVEVRRKSVSPGGKDQVFTVDVALIQDKGKTDSDLPLEAGDVIYVPERLVRF
jgi:protein involved in polysaccharide export with SLBB domain